MEIKPEFMVEGLVVLILIVGIVASIIQGLNDTNTEYFGSDHINESVTFAGGIGSVNYPEIFNSCSIIITTSENSTISNNNYDCFSNGTINLKSGMMN